MHLYYCVFFVSSAEKAFFAEQQGAVCFLHHYLWHFPPVVFNLQQLADESQMRIELQMALDSKDSDIEQLRNLLQSLSVQSMDSASVSSGPEFDADDAYTGGSLTTGWSCYQASYTVFSKSIEIIYLVYPFRA